MKCPKCEYLGFEASDRCRNCGYEFSLSQSTPAPFDLPIDESPSEPLIPSPDSLADDARPRLDLNRIIGGPPQDLPLFEDVEPLISTPSRPRVPLSVRRTTPEIPQVRVKTRPLVEEMLFEPRPAVTQGQPATSQASATPFRRIMAALIDFALLSALDAGVLYFTLRLLGLASIEILELPAIPLLAFLLMLNGGYFVAFTAVGGQSIGKMAFGIKVVDQDDEEDGVVPIGRATLRTFAYLVSALPLGAGFLPGVLGANRLALHDRLAHTRVVRPSST
jgi:uncharacterized RDD family membrane protein YckC